MVAFTDLNSKLVLSSSAAVNPSREELDQLGMAAGSLLRGPMAESTSDVADGDGGADTAMTLTQGEMRIFLTCAGSANEALVCVCAPTANLAEAVGNGRDALGRILAQS